MNAVTPEHLQPLNAAIDEVQAQRDLAQAELGGLAEQLHVIDGELEELAAQRERYELVAQACGSLERLSTLGAIELFWGDAVDRGFAAEHVRRARERLERFRERVAEVEGRRQELVQRIAEGREVLAILEDDLLELEAEREELESEWLIEREMDPAAERAPTMPWVTGG